MARRTAKSPKPEAAKARWSVYALPLLFFLAQVVILPGAASPFRLPKLVLTVSGLAMIVAIGFAMRLRKDRLTLPSGHLTVAILAYPALQAISCLWGAAPTRSLSSAAVSAVWVAGVIWLATLQSEERDRVLRWTVAGATVSAAISLLQSAGVSLLAVETSGSETRLHLTGLTGNPADLAMAAALLLPLIVSRLEHEERSWRSWICPIILVTAIVVSQTMAGYAALTLVVITWVIRSRSRKLALTVAGVIALIAIAVVFTAPPQRFEILEKRIKNRNWYALLSAREDGWTAAAQMIQEAPVLGVGASHFGHSYYPSRLAWLESRNAVGRRGEMATHFTWAHCDPLQLLAELGIPGALWLVAVLGAAFWTRRRGDPMLVLSAAALLPFSLLHYPTHVAVGLIPLALVLAHLLAANGETISLTLKPGVARLVLALILVGCGITFSLWQVRHLALDLWRGHMETLLIACQTAEEPQRSKIALTVELQAEPRSTQNPAAAPWSWRLVGRARLALGAGVEAETAFRSAYALWPHEEADFGLGLALALQGRRAEALLRLGRVCRTNPALIKLIPDDDLRRALEDLNRQRRRRQG